MPRSYTPKVGDTVKLGLAEDYAGLVPEHREIVSRCIRGKEECRSSIAAKFLTPEEGETITSRLYQELSDFEKSHDVPGLWAYFKVLKLARSVRGATPVAELVHIHRAVNAPEPPWQGWVEVSKIEPPLGWEPVYSIYAKDAAQAEKITTDWFKRGIRVFVNVNMSSRNCEAHAFAPVPADDSPPATPGWQYGSSALEEVMPQLCPHVFKVYWTEELDVSSLPVDAKERRAHISKLKAEGWECEYNRRWHEWMCTRDHLIYQPKEE